MIPSHQSTVAEEVGRRQDGEGEGEGWREGKRDVRGRRGEKRGGVGGRRMEGTEGGVSRSERRDKYTYTKRS